MPDDLRLALQGGVFLMGTDYPHGYPEDGEGPVRPVTVPPFEIDAFPVTNSRFANFIRETGYLTDAERFGWSFVFWKQIPRDRFESLVEDTVAAAPWWCKVPGARWSEPYGPGSSTDDIQDHPVVHVSWNDASAFCDWANLALPTEAQWEYAARGGLEQKLFPWGDDLTPNGQHLCNVWQGRFPYQNTAEDGYPATSPVTAFPPNQYGLYSVTGNTWEWCLTPFREDLSEAKVIKGGSFLCHASYCNRYRLAARTSNTPESSASNIGFRCVRNQPN